MKINNLDNKQKYFSKYVCWPAFYTSMVSTPNYKRMTPEEYIQLYEKYVAGHCSPEEKQLLFSYGDSFQLQEPEIKLSVEDRQARLRGYHDLTDRLSRSKRIIRMRTWWAAAAVLLIFCLTGLLFSLSNNKPASKVIASTAILPGKPMAVLTLNNGKTIRLDEARNGVLAETAGSTIRKMKNGELVYQALGNQIGDDQPINNTISIPAGGEYRLTLPDGTKVWLNSASRLTFPARFSGSERYVELNGEAYFEVAKNKKMPFIVKAGETRTEVLGTHFNIMAYRDESVVKTTLLEGSVRFSNGTSNVLMKPGQQGTAITGASQLRVDPADMAEAIAWKDGYFIFKNENVKSLMRRIARWYNVDVSYEGDVEHKVFGGTFSRQKNLSELLTSLEQIGTVHFKVEGRRVTVMP